MGLNRVAALLFHLPENSDFFTVAVKEWNVFKQRFHTVRVRVVAVKKNFGFLFGFNKLITTPNWGSGLYPTKISGGIDFMCALLNDGSVKCTGRNNNGQLGDGTSTDKTSPGAALNFGGLSAIDLAVGYDHACAVLSDGTMQCWGRAKTSGGGGVVTGVFLVGNSTNNLGDANAGAEQGDGLPYVNY